MTELTWKDSNITSIGQMAGKKVGVWCCGNENELYAALNKNNIDPKTGVTIVNQPFNMNLFLNRDVDAAAAMTYNELAQVLETKNPKTGKLYTPSDLNVITMEDAGTGMLEDGVFVRGDWIKDKDNQETATKFLAASFKGWAYCRDHLAECTQIVLDNGPTLGKGHQTWMMNEINALIWPAPDGIGVMNKAAFDRHGADRPAVQGDLEGAERGRLHDRHRRSARSTSSTPRASTSTAATGRRRPSRSHQAARRPPSWLTGPPPREAPFSSTLALIARGGPRCLY